MTLFRQRYLYVQIEQRKQKIASMVEKIPRDQFSSSNDQAIIDGIVAPLKIEPLVLHEEQIEKHDGKETKIEMSRHSIYHHYPSVDGMEYNADIPFEGEYWLFECQTPTLTMLGCPGEVVGDKVRISISYPLDSDDCSNPKKLNKDFEQKLELLKEYVTWSGEQVAAYNNQLPQLVEKAVLVRREKINKVDEKKMVV